MKHHVKHWPRRRWYYWRGPLRDSPRLVDRITGRFLDLIMVVFLVAMAVRGCNYLFGG